MLDRLSTRPKLIIADVLVAATIACKLVNSRASDRCAELAATPLAKNTSRLRQLAVRDAEYEVRDIVALS